MATKREGKWGQIKISLPQSAVREDWNLTPFFELRADDNAFYNYFVKQLLKHCAGLDNARVKIDGSGDREFKRKLQAYLKRDMGQGKVASVKFADSANDDLIQLADMVVGAVARSYRPGEEPEQSGRWRRMMGAKLLNCWEFK